MKRQISFWLSCFLFAFAVNAHGQVGKDTGLWDWTEKATHHQSIVKVEAGEGSGTGIVIHVDKTKPIKNGYEGYCLTAWHVVKDINDNSIKVKFRNGKRSKGCRVVQEDRERDIALIWAWVPAEIQPAKLASEPIKGGDKLEFAGLGGGSDLKCCLRHFSGVASSPSSLEKIFADVALLPGDSGGPVFNEKRKLLESFLADGFGMTVESRYPMEATLVLHGRQEPAISIR